MQSNTAVSTVNIPKSRRSGLWTYRINKLLVNPNECLNNIILESTIKKHGRFPSDKTRWEFCRLWLVCCRRQMDWNHTVNLQLCFRTCSHTYFLIKGIDECQQQWFLTARFSNRKKRTKFTTYTMYHVFPPAHRTNDRKTTQKPRPISIPGSFLLSSKIHQTKKTTKILKNLDSNPY